ncbi:MAG: hypothetical protein K6F69_01240, partial [Treponema sp.]|nr:hypothetical protein [Treponema sp.]
MTNINEDKEPSLISIIIDMILGRNKDSPETRKQFSAIAKNLSKTKYNGYYHPLTSKLMPPCASFLFYIYKNIYPLQKFFNERFFVDKSAHHIIDAFMSDEQVGLKNEFDENIIREKSKTEKYQDFSIKIKKLINDFKMSFDKDKYREINSVYNALILLRQFCVYDYYFILKKFCPDIKEGSFSGNPRFSKVWGAYIAEPLANFDSVAKGLLRVPFEDWASAIGFINKINGEEIISVEKWNTLVYKINDIEKYSIFENICKLINKDLSFSVRASYSETDIVTSYVNDISRKVFEILNVIKQEQQRYFIATELKKLFPKGFEQPLKYYLSEMDIRLEAKKLPVFKYSEALSYLQAFILSYVNGDISSIASKINVYGSVINRDFVIQLLNTCSYLGTNISEQIVAFDGKLAPKMPLGYKLSNFLSQATSSEQDTVTIRAQVDLINANALSILNDS